MEIKPGIYRHYKGNLYRIHHTVKNSEDWENGDMILYEALYDTPPECKFMVRPAHMFTETVEWEGKNVSRFALQDQTEVESNHPHFSSDEILKLVRLLSILQLTKQQPLNGYLTCGIKLSETATLAEHQYTSALSAFLVCQAVVSRGGRIDTQKVITILLIHDLGELFGGDIASPLNRRFPELREYKDKIGERAFQLLTEFVSLEGREKIINLYHEFEEGSSDEKWVAKILDQMDHQFFLEHHSYRQRLTEDKHSYRNEFVKSHVYKLSEKIVDPVTRTFFEEFFLIFKEKFYAQGFIGINELL